MERRDFLKTLGVIVGGATIVGTFIPPIEYLDLPGPTKTQTGRTKNGIAAVIAGLVGKKLYDNSIIDLEIQKHAWPDARVTGQTTPTSISTSVDLTTTHVYFNAQKNGMGLLEGEVDKSEVDWQVKQTSQNHYEIARWGPKFDSELDLNVSDGKISGTYIRTGPHFDWEITGTYENNGNVNIEIDGPLNLGIMLVGKINKL